MKTTKQQLDALQSKFQKVEEENKKLTEQLKQAVAKNNEKPVQPTPSLTVDPPKPKPIKATEPVKTEPNKVTEPVKTESIKTTVVKSFMPNYSRPEPKTDPPKYGASVAKSDPSTTNKTEPAKTEVKKYPFNNYYAAPKSFVPPTKTSDPAKNVVAQPKSFVPSSSTPSTPSTSSTAASSTYSSSTTPAKTELKTAITTTTTKNEVENQRASVALGPRHLKAIGNVDFELSAASSPKSARHGSMSLFYLFLHFVIYYLWCFILIVCRRSC